MLKLFAPFVVIILACLVTKWIEDTEDERAMRKDVWEKVKQSERSHYKRYTKLMPNQTYIKRHSYTSAPMYRKGGIR